MIDKRIPERISFLVIVKTLSYNDISFSVLPHPKYIDLGVIIISGEGGNKVLYSLEKQKIWSWTAPEWTRLFLRKNEQNQN